MIPTYRKIGAVALFSLSLGGAAIAEPPELKNLEVTKVERLSFLLNYTSHTSIEEPKPGDLFKFRYEDTQRRRNTSEYVEVGASLFPDGPMKGRFHFRDIMAKKVMNQRGLPEIKFTAELVDQRPNKFGTVYKLGKGSGRKGLIIRDYTATLSFKQPGKDEQLLRVEENESFKLPFDRQDADHWYTFRGVDKDGRAVIEYEIDGKLLLHKLDVPEE